MKISIQTGLIHQLEHIRHKTYGDVIKKNYHLLDNEWFWEEAGFFPQENVNKMDWVQVALGFRAGIRFALKSLEQDINSEYKKDFKKLIKDIDYHLENVEKSDKNG